MARKKRDRFAQNSEMSCVVQPAKDEIQKGCFALKGKWRTDFFHNNNPIVLELGCGKGEYTLALAKKYPEQNFIGIDVKGARIWYGAKSAMDEGMKNVAFLRARVEMIANFFGPDEVDEIWLTFSDPQPQKPNKRLTSTTMVQTYRSFLKAFGRIHLKTDNSMLFAWTQDEIKTRNYLLGEALWDIDSQAPQNAELADILHVRTHYEDLFRRKGFDIKYLNFSIS